MLRNNRFTCFLYLGLLLLAATTATAQTGGCGRLYVDSAVAVSGNGSSWTTAFKTVSQALDSANRGTCTSREIWVAKGTYYPMAGATTIAGSRDSSFRILRNGIKLYGGFAGGETVLSARNVAANPTILSGDIGVVNDSTDNSHHVVTILSSSAIDSSTRIEGFTVQQGNSNGTGWFVIGSISTSRSQGGGAYITSTTPYAINCRPLISKCTFSYNTGDYGAGINNISCSPYIYNCAFSFNNAGTGGGIYNTLTSNPVITNCSFTYNTVINSGGGIGNTGSSPIISNCIFAFNSGNEGSGIKNLSASTPLITNCTFWANTSNIWGSGITNYLASPTITNCVLWGNTSGTGTSIYTINNSSSNAVVNYTTVETPQTGTGNDTAYPLFVDTTNVIGTDGIWGTADDGLRLQLGSPAVNSGSNAAVPAGITTDITGAVRIQQGNVDRGAYESGFLSCPAGNIVYVDSSKTTSGDGSSWANAYKTLSQGLWVAHNCATVTQVWVAKGTYYPMNGFTTIATSRDSSFRILRNGIKLYGGFAGGETVLSARNPGTNPTILSGDIGLVGNSTDNSKHVVTVVSNSTIDTSTRIDGFVITRGNANLFLGATFSVAGKVIEGVHGGGIYNHSSSPLITNCIFSYNSSLNIGGGMYNLSSSPAITNCIFLGNTAAGGAGMNNSSSSLSVTNCAFFSNSCYNTSSGGGISNQSSSLFLTNCTFYSNSSSFAAGGGGIYNYNNSNTTITNCILWGNTAPGSPDILNGSGSTTLTVSYSNTQTPRPGAGNSTADPFFINAANPIGPDGIWGTADDGLRLAPCSPAINTGSNAAIPAGITTDITGAARIQNTTVDKGAYEMPYNSIGISVTTITQLPANPVCNTTSVTFTAATTFPGSVPVYQWYKNGVAVGTSQTTYTASGWNNGDSVWVVHTNNDCGVNDTSAKSFVQLVPLVAQPGPITGNTAPCPGTQTYSVAAVTGAMSYTWTVPAGWALTAGQGTTAITVTSTSATGNVSVTANNSCGAASVVRSLAVTLLPTPPVPATPAGPAAVCPSSTGNVYSTTAITGATTYTWAVPAGWVITAGQGTTAITVTAAAGTTSGFVTVNAGNGCQTSSTASLSVSGGAITPTVVVSKNTGDTICAGTAVTFTATITIGGTSPAYQWKKNGLNVGANSAAYTDAALVNGDVVTVVLTSNSPCAAVAGVTAANTVIGVVTSIVPAISVAAMQGTVLCAGESKTFTLNSTGGGLNPAYKWYRNGVAIPGATGLTYTGANFANNDAISVLLTSNATCRSVDTARSNSVTLTVNPNVIPVVTVTANPGTSVPAGTAVTFTANVTAGANNATYQWYKNGLAIAGATSSTYTSNTLQGGDLIWVQVAALGPCATPDNLTSEPLRISDPAGIQTVRGGGNWKESLLLHPNPNTGRFTISADWGGVFAGEKVSVAVVNSLGQFVYSEEVSLSAGRWSLDIELKEGVANGLYMLRVNRQKDGSRTAIPVLIQR